MTHVIKTYIRYFMYFLKYGIFNICDNKLFLKKWYTNIDIVELKMVHRYD